MWDDKDPATDAYLHAAILLGMALVMRVRTTGDAGDIAALRDIQSRIESELSRLEKMEKHSEAIRKNVDGISDEIRKAQKALDRLLQNAQSTLRALNVEVHDEAAERTTPIGLSTDSLNEAAVALSGGGQAA
jgi:predicted  nucleic acid-binding Zn-ribbon protein